jgi:hypothetical protein
LWKSGIIKRKTCKRFKGIKIRNPRSPEGARIEKLKLNVSSITFEECFHEEW